MILKEIEEGQKNPEKNIQGRMEEKKKKKRGEITVQSK